MAGGARAWTITAAEAGATLAKFLAHADRLGSHGRALDAIGRGKVFVNGSEATEAARRLHIGEEVRVWIDRPGTATRRAGRTRKDRRELRIVYEDAALIIIDKPAGMLSVPLPAGLEAESVYDRVERHLRPQSKRRPLVVHRIDRDTSGLVVFAKTPHAQAGVKAQFARREPERVYLAVVYGDPQPSAGTWRSHIVWDEDALAQRPTTRENRKAKTAISEYRVIERFRDASLLEVRLHTGKQHQIRVQAREHGHPLIGERKYVDPAPYRPVTFRRQALHAYRLGFRHPTDGRMLRFECPLPEDMAHLLERLRRSRSRNGPQKRAEI
jgi:23S rRNA pseudouridine1911/1915/1917 synthase